MHFDFMNTLEISLFKKMEFENNLKSQLPRIALLLFWGATLNGQPFNQGKVSL